MADNGELYQQFHTKVYAYLFASVKNQHTAQDLCSEVFLKIYGKWDTFDAAKSSVSTWIYNITKNTLYDYYRTNHPAAELNEEITENLEDLDDSVDREEELKSLAGALQTLSKTERKIVVGKYYSGKTLQVLADELGLSLFRVWSMHKKSLEKLKKIMQQDQNLGS